MKRLRQLTFPPLAHQTELTVLTSDEWLVLNEQVTKSVQP